MCDTMWLLLLRWICIHHVVEHHRSFETYICALLCRPPPTTTLNLTAASYGIYERQIVFLTTNIIAKKHRFNWFSMGISGKRKVLRTHNRKKLIWNQFIWRVAIWKKNLHHYSPVFDVFANGTEHQPKWWNSFFQFKQDFFFAVNYKLRTGATVAVYGK